MNPQLTAQLAAEHRRDLSASAVSHQAAKQFHDNPRAGRGRRRALLPRYRFTWTRTTLAAVAGGRPGRSVVIVFSATRAY